MFRCDAFSLMKFLFSDMKESSVCVLLASNKVHCKRIHILAMDFENSESVHSTFSTPKSSKPSPTSPRPLTPPSSTGSNGGSTTKKRIPFTSEQKQILKEAFEVNNYLDADTKEELASKTNLNPRKIKVSLFISIYVSS